MFVFPADIKKSIKSNYQREYNFIFIIVGLSTIIGIILTILSSFLLLNYLVSIDARNLFINSLNSNFSTIFIPIALFLFFPIMLMNMQPIKYYLSLEKTNTNNKLMILGIIEIVYIPLVILTLFFQETNLKVILINLPIVGAYIYLLYELKKSIKIDIINYLFFTGTTYLLVPFFIIIYNGGFSTITDIRFISLYLYFMLTGLGLSYIFIKTINETKKPNCLFYIIISIVILFLISLNPLLNINFSENSLTILGIRENTQKNYMIHEDFFYKNNNKLHMDKTKITLEKGDKVTYYMICGKKLFENTETFVLEIENNKYQIPNKYINNIQNYENKNSQPNNASKCNS